MMCSNVSPMMAINMLSIVICVKKVAQMKMVIVMTDIIGWVSANETGPKPARTSSYCLRMASKGPNPVKSLISEFSSAYRFMLLRMVRGKANMISDTINSIMNGPMSLIVSFINLIKKEVYSKTLNQSKHFEKRKNETSAPM